MGVPAGLLNRRAAFLRRPAISPLDFQRAGYLPHGLPCWAGFRPRNPVEIVIGGLSLDGLSAVLTVRDSAFTRDLTPADRVQIGTDVYQIVSALPAEKSDGMIRFAIESAPTRALYDHELDRRGEMVVVRLTVANSLPVDVRARAIITGYQPNEIAGGIQVGERRVYLSAKDLAKTWTAAPRVNDKLLIRGGAKALNILNVDDSTHRIAGELFVYDIRAAG